MSDQRLSQFLNESKPWEKKVTNILGVILLKLPTFKNTPPSIAIEINPVNATSGSTTKKRGIIIGAASELEEFSRLLSNPKVSQLAKMLEEVNPERKTTATTSSDIFEI